MSEGDWDLTTRRTKEERHYRQREQHGQRRGAVEHTVFVGIGKELKTTRFLITSIAVFKGKNKPIFLLLLRSVENEQAIYSKIIV